MAAESSRDIQGRNVLYGDPRLLHHRFDPGADRALRQLYGADVFRQKADPFSQYKILFLRGAGLVDPLKSEQDGDGVEKSGAADPAGRRIPDRMEPDLPVFLPYPVDGAFFAPHAAGDPGAFERRTRRGGRYKQRPLMPERDLAVRPDIAEQRRLFLPAHAGMQDRRRDVRADEGIHTGRKIRREPEDILRPVKKIVRLKRRVRKGYRILSAEEIQHRGISDDDCFFRRGRIPVFRHRMILPARRRAAPFLKDFLQHTAERAGDFVPESLPFPGEGCLDPSHDVSRLRALRVKEPPLGKTFPGGEVVKRQCERRRADVYGRAETSFSVFRNDRCLRYIRRKGQLDLGLLLSVRKDDFRIPGKIRLTGEAHPRAG